MPGNGPGRPGFVANSGETPGGRTPLLGSLDAWIIRCLSNINIKVVIYIYIYIYTYCVVFPPCISALLYSCQSTYLSFRSSNYFMYSAS